MRKAIGNGVRKKRRTVKKSLDQLDRSQDPYDGGSPKEVWAEVVYQSYFSNLRVAELFVRMERWPENSEESVVPENTIFRFPASRMYCNV